MEFLTIDFSLSRRVTFAALLATLLLPFSARAADVSVSYTVDEKLLKLAITGTPLTFKLYTDSGCTTLSDSVTVAIDNVDVIERLKRFKPKGGLIKPPKTARLVEGLSGVTAPPTLFLTVTGTGITPVGGACQLQFSSTAGTSLPCASQVGNEVYFTGCNVNVQNGSGLTATDNKLGNLIVGYNYTTGQDRSGSHNLVIGDEHSYSSHGGFVAGISNTISGAFASVSGGTNNTAAGFIASVSGGNNNNAIGGMSWVGGGFSNNASGGLSSITGGQSNIASGEVSSVSGGQCNKAGAGPAQACTADTSGNIQWVGGGVNNLASGSESSVTGGVTNQATNTFAVVNGGNTNIASGISAVVSGGLSNQATNQDATVGGGSGVVNSTAFTWHAREAAGFPTGTQY
jgi:hypothetical protein